MYTPENLQEFRVDSIGTHVTGIKMHEQLMSVGHSNGSIEMFDIERGSKLRKLSWHTGRVSSMIYMDNLLISGGKDRSIMVHDLRLQESVVKTFNRHKG